MPARTTTKHARAIIEELDRQSEPPTETGIRNRVRQALKGTRRATRDQRERDIEDAIRTHYQRRPWAAAPPELATIPRPTITAQQYHDERRRAKRTAEKADAAARAERAAAAEYRDQAMRQTDPAERAYYERQAAQRITNAKRAATIAAAARRRTYTHPSGYGSAYGETVNPDPSNNDDDPGSGTGTRTGSGPAAIVDITTARQRRQAAAQERIRTGSGAAEEGTT
jgi:hypothetical protein